MRIVVALGGNALLQRGQKPDAEPQIENVRLAAKALAPLAAEHELVITHGNGPQVGVFAVQSASDPNLTKSYPFDTLGAMTEGMIGYWMLQALSNEMPDNKFASLNNQTLVDAHDPAFENPTKFVGEVMDEETAKAKAEQNGWTVKADGEKWRRVVPSPKPIKCLEAPAIDTLMSAGITVICNGGGGVPVTREEDGRLVGSESVIDKDATAALLATQINADRLIILTDVENVMKDFGKDTQEAIGQISFRELKEMDFPAGSMGPKIDACVSFVESGGVAAAIGRLDDAAELVDGTKGTYITH